MDLFFYIALFVLGIAIAAIINFFISKEIRETKELTKRINLMFDSAIANCKETIKVLVAIFTLTWLFDNKNKEDDEL